MELSEQIELALDAFWSAAYSERRDQRNWDDEDRTAQKAEEELRNAIINALMAASTHTPSSHVAGIDWFETCLNIVHEHKKVYVVERDDLKRRGKANAHFYAQLVYVCDSISQAIHDANATPSPESNVAEINPVASFQILQAVGQPEERRQPAGDTTSTLAGPQTEYPLDAHPIGTTPLPQVHAASFSSSSSSCVRTTDDSTSSPSSHVWGAVKAEDCVLSIGSTRVCAHGTHGCVNHHAPAPAPSQHVEGRWLPIEQADRTITNVDDFSEVGVILRTSDRYWVRDEDGRVYQAAWSEGNNGERDYWWDFEGESPVDPVEFMPHPRDSRFATSEGRP